ncbi:MAG: M13 family metallopeptidase [Bacteroidota bacterium]|jgi:putative endopeptidase|nr:MAG: M13 family peptidase [Bacteroidota bacterium]
MRYYNSAVIAFLLILVASCSSKKSETKLPDGVGLLISNMDTTVKPAEDFYRFANGGWLDRAQIPADRGSWGSFHELREKTQADVLEVLKSATDNSEYAEGSDQRKVSDFFEIGMDSLLSERVGMKAIDDYIKQIDAIAGKADIQKYFTKQQLYGGNAFFSIEAFPDLTKSDVIAVYLSGEGIGLPERDYYFDKSSKGKETREKYLAHVARMLELSGIDKSSAARQANAIMKIETALAHATLTKEERRDPGKIYNKRSVNQLATMMPSFDWNAYFTDLGLSGIDSVVVVDIDFLPAVEKIISTTPIADVKSYFRWHLINLTAPYLNHEMVSADFDFYSKYLDGVEKMRPRWRRVLAQTDEALGEALGKLYVDKHFPPEAKQKAMEMVENIKRAFAERIKNLDWMSDSTKQKALEKLSTFTVKIGYPDEWKDYSALVVDRNPETASYAQNVLNAKRFNLEQQLAKYGKPVDHKEWGMTPQTVNAYYNPLFNEIVFPAAILQPPFYDYRADEAVNYGGMGAVIGHEISHGFDDQGSRFDAEGNLRNWWTEKDLAQFRERGKALAAQYSQYQPLDSVFVNGEFTLGENIGDLGGLSAASDGLQLHLKEHGRPGLIDGFTPEQRFFLSWATVWRSKYRDETLRQMVKTDPHSPGMYRAVGPLVNIDAFYEAFNIKEGDPMYRPASERVKIW